ncbi:hypothetical protein OIU76_019551 [Salix suchowensis]|nr:hypothetical protein OIU76_019551 [Salix suchowensis]
MAAFSPTPQQLAGATRQDFLGPPHHNLLDFADATSTFTQSCDPAIIHSSIALLQERFRQLERAKEMRQQRELLKLFSEADHVQSAMACESSKLLHSELTLPPRQPIQASLSFQPTLQTEHNDLKAPIVANLCSTDSVMNLRYNFDESDVDTSLHL